MRYLPTEKKEKISGIGNQWYPRWAYQMAPDTPCEIASTGPLKQFGTFLLQSLSILGTAMSRNLQEGLVKLILF